MPQLIPRDAAGFQLAQAARLPAPARGLLAILLVLFAASMLHAGDGDIVQLPLRGAKPKHGLTLQVDSRWTGAYGYRPIRVTASIWPPGKAAADRVLLIEATANYYQGGRGANTVSCYLEIPQGQSTASTTILVPSEQEWMSLSLDVYEDGYRLDELSRGYTTDIARYSTGWSEYGAGMLVIDSDAPSLAERSAGLPVRLSGTKQLPDVSNMLGDRPAPNDMAVMTQVQRSPTLELLAPADLPDTWLAYSSIDFAFISLDDLRLLATNHPEKLTAVRLWCATGPTLCILGAGDDYRGLAEIDRLLEVPANPRGAAGTSPDGGDPSTNKRDALLEKIGDWLVPPQFVPGSGARKAELDRAGFVTRHYAFGTIVAFADDNPFRGASERWETLHAALGSRWSWPGRHALTPREAQPQFWNMLIPSVNLAPVTPFRVLITLFVIVIGPVNYFLLRRVRRAYLMLVTAPAAALLVTGFLLGYAVLADGFSVKARVRSLTWLDQRSGTHVSWSRQTYFAGYAPPEGMIFPQDTAVYPLEAEHAYNARRRIDWRKDEQRLSEGYLPARQTRQMVVVQANQKAKARIDVRETSGGGASPQITNHLAARIEKLLLTDSQGKTHWGEGIAAGATVKLSRVDALQGHRRIWQSYQENENLLPDAAGAYPLRGASRRYYAYSRDDSDVSLLELAMVQWMTGAERVPAGVPATMGGQIMPRSYVAVVASPTGVPLGVRGASEEASLHVVVGRW